MSYEKIIRRDSGVVIRLLDFLFSLNIESWDAEEDDKYVVPFVERLNAKAEAFVEG